VASIIKDKARVFNANQFLNLFSSGSTQTWKAGGIYTTNDVVINNSREYVATTSGTAGGTPPTHTTGNVSDGGVMWQYVKPAKVTNFYNNNVFMSLGKTTNWPDEQNPPQAMNYTEQDYNDLSDSVFMKKLGSANAAIGIMRNQWTSGLFYDSYVTNVELDTIKYYVTNASNRIYICIDNNGGLIPSTSEPTDTNTTIQSFKTGDGYTWKYMGSVSDLNFIATDYVPVAKILNDNGSDQWEIQQNSAPNSLMFVDVLQSGSVFIDGIPTVDIEGTAVATATLSSNVLTEITLTDVGANYTKPPYCAIIPQVGTDRDNHQPIITTIVDGGGAVTGFDITNAGQYNNGVYPVTATVTSGSGTGCVITPLFTGFVLTGFTIVNPGSNYTNSDTVNLNDGDGDVEAHDVIIEANVGTSSGLGSNILEDCNAKYIILNDDLIGNEAGYFDTDIGFRQVMLVVDPYDNSGDIASALRYYGPSGTGYAGASDNQKVSPGTGSLIYVDNIEVIERTTNQQENVKIILKF